MTNPNTGSGSSRHRYLTERDEMSLTEEKAAQTRESDPDTLEVGDDSMAILQGTMNDMRRPLLMIVVVAVTAVLGAAALAVLIGAAHKDSAIRAG
jgi:hypothetical protein